MSGSEGSSIKQFVACAAGRPDAGLQAIFYEVLYAYYRKEQKEDRCLPYSYITAFYGGGMSVFGHSTRKIRP